MAAKLLLILLPLCCCILLSILAEGEVPAMYVFGDSLADVGNNNHLEFSFLKANFPHNGVDYPGSQATGRFSNGKNSADFLAEMLGVPSPPPYLSIPANINTTLAFLRGVSFASGGAGVLNSTGSGQCLTLSKQIDYYATMRANLVERMGDARARAHLSRSMYVFMVGSNDVLEYVKSSDEQRRTITARQLVDSMVSALDQQLKRLKKLGARKFAFAGTGPIGCCPKQRKDSSAAECNADTNKISADYGNRAASLLQELKSEFGDMSYSFFDSSRAMTEFIRNPHEFGFSDARAACCGIGDLNAVIACIPVSGLCENRTSYVFWDLYHPTEAAARLLAERFFGGAPPYVFPVNVKQLGDL